MDVTAPDMRALCRWYMFYKWKKRPLVFLFIYVSLLSQKGSQGPYAQKWVMKSFFNKIQYLLN